MNILVSFIEKLTAEIDSIKSLNVFEKAYYRTQFDKADAPKYSQLLEHYYQMGWKMGKNPCTWFDTDFYLIKYSDVREGKVNPFYHYLYHGFKEGRLPNPDVSEQFLRHIVDVDNMAYSLSILSRHQDIIHNKSVNSSVVLPELTSKFLEACQIQASKEFLSPYFNKKWYGDFYGVPHSKALNHFNELGKYLGLAPCEMLLEYAEASEVKNWFEAFTESKSRLAYLDYNKLTDIQKCYEVYTSELFDSDWYAKEYPQLTRDQNELVHFSLYGIYAGKNPNRFFDQKWYKENYLLDDSYVPFIHYVQNRASRQFGLINILSIPEYVRRHPMLSSVDLAPIENDSLELEIDTVNLSDERALSKVEGVSDLLFQANNAYANSQYHLAADLYIRILQTITSEDGLPLHLSQMFIGSHKIIADED